MKRDAETEVEREGWRDDKTETDGEMTRQRQMRPSETKIERQRQSGRDEETK